MGEGARPQLLSAHELACARDAAWEIMQQRVPSEHTREVYESLAHLNNTLLLDGRWLLSLREIKAGEEILMTKGWSFYALPASRPRCRVCDRAIGPCITVASRGSRGASMTNRK